MRWSSTTTSGGSPIATTLTSLLLLPSTLALALNIPHLEQVQQLQQPPLQLHQKKALDLSLTSSSSSSSLQKSYRAAAYYINWAIYARNSPPQTLPTTSLTHLLYAFAGINNVTGAAYLTDSWSDVEKDWDGDVVRTDPATGEKVQDLFGCCKQLYLLKKKNRGFKTLLSFGGWALRENFAPALATEEGRGEFVRSSVEMMGDLGFDGLEIDWEYPSTPKQSSDLVTTIRLLRQSLDAYAANLTSNLSLPTSSPSPHFLLTISLPAGPQHFPYYDIPALSPHVDFFNLMAYDYMGAAFSNFSGHAQNLFKNERGNPRSTDFDTVGPVEWYVDEQGLEAGKLNLGMPLYGRSFEKTGGLGREFGNTTEGSWEAGVWDYKDLPLNGSQVHQDDQVVASWSYDSEKKLLVSYDTPSIAASKTRYLVDRQLGGAMWWETSADHPITDSRSLIRTVNEELGNCGGELEKSENWLSYPFSKYANLREGMEGQ